MRVVAANAVSARVVNGSEYLRLVTTLLQASRLRSPAGGIWEAADLQWWWRQERDRDQLGQLFWLDDAGEPHGAVVVTEFRSGPQCVVLVLPGGLVPQELAWQGAVRRADELGIAASFPVRSDDAVGLAALAEAGYRESAPSEVLASWLPAGRVSPVPDLAAGYRLVSRASDGRQPHWLTARNGTAVETRLRECSLYRPDLDLAVIAPDGEVAGYALFWPDPVTKVGLVEPMRTEDAHQRRGIASHLLVSGLHLLAAAGCERLKVGSDRGIYLRAGLAPDLAARFLTYGRPRN
jgi:predicted N-acetyltransferase YhbS